LLLKVAERLATEGDGSSQTVAEIKKRIRWEAPGDGRKIRIMRRGSKVKGISNVVAEISQNGKYKDLYPSWQKALAERAELMIATGSNRVSHKDIAEGAIPEK